MEDLAESELLGDESESDLLAYQRLAFGRLRLSECEIENQLQNRFIQTELRVTYKIIDKPNKHVQYYIEFNTDRYTKVIEL